MRHLGFILACLAFASGCASSWPRSQWLHRPYEEIWQACHVTLPTWGYPPAVAHKHRGVLDSAWQNQLHPLRGEGRRRRVSLRIVAIRQALGTIIPKNAMGKNGFYQIRLRVFCQRNHAEHDFMSTRNALWLADGYDQRLEKLLIQAIESRLRPKVIGRNSTKQEAKLHRSPKTKNSDQEKK